MVALMAGFGSFEIVSSSAKAITAPIALVSYEVTGFLFVCISYEVKRVGAKDYKQN